MFVSFSSGGRGDVNISGFQILSEVRVGKNYILPNFVKSSED